LTAMGQEWPEYGGSLAGSGTRPRNRLQLAYDNLWDYDTASQPPLFVWCGNLPAVAMMNKTGMVYMFNRLQHGETLVALRWRSEL
jgi:glucose dehydrogenase